MKTLIPKSAVLAALLGIFLAPSAFAKKKPLDLTAFAGNYTGTVSLVTPGGNSSGTATVVIHVPKNGKSATIDYTAVTTSGGSTTELPTAITLARGGSLSITDLGIGIAGTNNAHRGTGSWSQRKRTLSLQATNGDIDFTATGHLKKDSKKKRKLALTLVTSDADGSNAYVFTTTLTAKLAKTKK